MTPTTQDESGKLWRTTPRREYLQWKETTTGWCSGEYMRPYHCLSRGNTACTHRRNPQYKKHKTWDGDAVLVVSGHKCALYDSDGRQ